MDALRAEGLTMVGASNSLAGARTPVVFERKGLRIGLLAYTASAATWADDTHAGAAPMRDEFVDADLRQLRANVDVVLLSLHFGLMYTDYPQRGDQVRLRRWADMGADVILGHHPHVCQGIERYHNKVIAYSLGELVFDPRAGNVVAEHSLAVRRDTYVLRCVLQSDGGVDADYIPVEIGDDLAPRLADSQAAERIRSRIERISAPLQGDGLSRIDVVGHAGSQLAGHEMRVMWHHVRRLNFAYIGGKLVRIRPRHLRMAWGAILARMRAGNRT
jgi:poly-gamma-glutamate synthesis protein (capsule biosynthesis protein)